MYFYGRWGFGVSSLKIWANGLFFRSNKNSHRKKRMQNSGCCKFTLGAKLWSLYFAIAKNACQVIEVDHVLLPLFLLFYLIPETSGKIVSENCLKPWTSRLDIFNEYWTCSTAVHCCLSLNLLDTVLKSIIITRFAMGHMPLYTKISVILVEPLFQRKSTDSKLAFEYF